MTRAALPLAGIKVVAIEQAVAAPFCSSRLADAGATVTKIEQPGGDFARGYDDVASGQSSYFVWLNRGKDSRTMDLASARGKAALEALLVDADILLQNLKPGALARLGFDPAALRSRHPGLIICSISGYGETGPYADRKAYDLLVQAESGLASITGGADAPARVGISIVDIATGATAHAAILEALISRARDGEGAEIRISMFDVMADWLTVPLLHFEGGKPPRRIGLAHPSIAPYGVFRTSEGTDILIAIQNDREWRSFALGFLEMEEVIGDPRFSTNVARIRHRGATDAIVAARFGALKDTEVLARLDRTATAFASVNDMEGLSQHPQLRRIEVDTPNGPVTYPAPAPLFVGRERSYGPVPGLCEPVT
jgi:itaconate CoA-transferase